MLFHEAVKIVFDTFSRSVLRQGRLTACLADCGVFDMFDDKRTICLLIDKNYGVTLYDCLSHSPYKEKFDNIVKQVQSLYPQIDPIVIEYIFQSIRFAWGKIKTLRVPKEKELFAPKKKPTTSHRTIRKKSHKPPITHPKRRSAPVRRTRQALHRPSPQYRHYLPRTNYQTSPITTKARRKRTAQWLVSSLIFLSILVGSISLLTELNTLGLASYGAAALLLWIRVMRLR